MTSTSTGGETAPASSVGTPRRPTPVGRADDARAEGTRLRRVLLALWIVIAAAAALPGLPYYGMNAEARVYSEMHPLFAPTGVVGHSLGYVGTTMIVVGVGMYALRKRLPLLAGVGRLPTWLQVHIFLCTMGAYLVVLHSSFRLRGLAAVAFWSMVLAVLSGIVGRYIYVRIPRARDGHERTLSEVRARLAELASGLVASGIDAERLASLTGPPALPPQTILRAMMGAPIADVRRRAALARVRGALRGQDRDTRRAVFGAIDERLRLEQQIAFLAPMHRLLGYWHVLHIPVALLMFIALAVHIGVAILFGYGWPF